MNHHYLFTSHILWFHAIIETFQNIEVYSNIETKGLHAIWVMRRSMEKWLVSKSPYHFILNIKKINGERVFFTCDESKNTVNFNLILELYLALTSQLLSCLATWILNSLYSWTFLSVQQRYFIIVPLQIFFM